MIRAPGLFHGHDGLLNRTSHDPNYTIGFENKNILLSKTQEFAVFTIRTASILFFLGGGGGIKLWKHGRLHVQGKSNAGVLFCWPRWL